MSVKSGLPPIADPSTRLFILGSLPGERRSPKALLRLPTNQFWRLLGRPSARICTGCDYWERLAHCEPRRRLVGRGRRRASREGSGDPAIRDAATQPTLGGLKRDFPLLRAIAFNGGPPRKGGAC